MSPLVLKSPDNPRVQIRTLGICRKCRKYHKEIVAPDGFTSAAFRWTQKHWACENERPGTVEFLSPDRRIPKSFDDRVFEEAGIGPQWLDWRENADVKLNFVNDAAFTLDLSALAASSTWTAGRESTSVSNATNLYLDYFISGSFISGTTPTAPAEARLYYVRPIEDGPTWPDVFDGTDSAETVTNTNILASMLLGWSGTASATSNVTYPIQNALTLSEAFGIAPKTFVVFFTHAHTAALKTDAANTNSIYYQGVYATIA